jgi:hypothetical protein
VKLDWSAKFSAMLISVIGKVGVKAEAALFPGFFYPALFSLVVFCP